MFTQLFGNYLLNNKLISTSQLKDILAYQKDSHLKLGVLAISAGFMSAADVSSVHNMQTKVDKKFGELAIEMGFLDSEKLSTLLSTQKSGHLLLGQALIDRKYMTLEQFEEALNNYKKQHCLTNEQFKALLNDDIETLVNTHYTFEDTPQNKVYKSYLCLIIKNLIRFIDKHIEPLDMIPVQTYAFNCLESQEIIGEINFYTAISTNESSCVSLASKYAKEVYYECGKYVQEVVGEFLNLNNGLFLVNMSNNGVELELAPQAVDSGKTLTGLTEAFCIPLSFDFGKIDIIVSKSTPIIV